jgi:hypothetical protein
VVLLPVVMPLSGSQQDYFRNRPQQLQRRIDMKHLVLTALALVCLNIPAYAAGPDSFQCIRPDGSIVCTVNAPSGDPSVVCNHDCVDCNMTCVARQVVIREGDELIFNPGASRPVQPGQTGPGAVETPQYCQDKFNQCVSTCRSNPNDRTQNNVDACISSCSSAMSGCGKRP